MSQEIQPIRVNTRRRLDGIMYPTFSSCAAHMLHWLYWPLSVFSMAWHKKMQPCFEWYMYTKEYSMSDLILSSVYTWASSMWNKGKPWWKRKGNNKTFANLHIFSKISAISCSWLIVVSSSTNNTMLSVIKSKFCKILQCYTSHDIIQG